jgi:hypothetical protein
MAARVARLGEMWLVLDDDDEMEDRDPTEESVESVSVPPRENETREGEMERRSGLKSMGRLPWRL